MSLCIIEPKSKSEFREEIVDGRSTLIQIRTRITLVALHCIRGATTQTTSCQPLEFREHCIWNS